MLGVNQTNKWLSNTQRGHISASVVSPADSQQGLTLIECLVAIVVVALVGAIIGPAMVLSVATRVQSQKAEQALNLAQSEIDNIRLLVERGDYDVASLPPSTTTVKDGAPLAGVPGPVYGALVAQASKTTAYTQAREVDIDGDNSSDFAVQTFRTVGLSRDGVTPVTFGMGVRVYDINALNSTGSGNLPTEEASLALTSGEGERGQRPLAVLYTSIASSDDSQSFCNFIEYLSTTASTPLGCD